MIAAVVPAAGHSLRMGRPKLILPVGGMTVIARVVAALREGGASTIVVVPPPAEAPGAETLAREAIEAGAVVVVPSDRPADMRASVELALVHLAREADEPSLILLIPADSPGITPGLVARLIAHARGAPGAIVVPVHEGRRGHPIVLPWSLATEIRALPAGVGVNALIGIHAARVVELPVEDDGAFEDLDTPEDYQRWLAQSS